MHTRIAGGCLSHIIQVGLGKPINTVGCNNLLSNRKGIYKNFIKFKNRVKNCKKIYVDEAERAIYLKNFADKHNVTNRALDYQQNLVRKK